MKVTFYQRLVGFDKATMEPRVRRAIVDRRIDCGNENFEGTEEKARLAKAQATSDICADIRKMINNSEYSDVVFVCKDGSRVHACRLFLVARSTVFHRMLLNGMAESQLSEISLQKISSTAFLPVMEFLYTGTLEEHKCKDWRDAYEIIGAARFFLLEKLEFIVVHYLWLATAEVAGVDIAAAFKFLSITVEYVGIFGESVERIARELVFILESTSWKPEYLQALTDSAFRYFLEETKTEDAEPMYVSRAEFPRLIKVVLWCACQDFYLKAPLTSYAIPPEITVTLGLLEESSLKRKSMDCQESEMYRRLKPTLALSVKKYLPLIDFRRILPSLLVEIIEPMDIIPSSTTMDAFRFHALRTPLKFEEDTHHGWETSNNKLYRMGRDGSRIQQTVSGIGFARYTFAMDSYNKGYPKVEKFVWEIIIEQVCDSFLEIGVHHDLHGQSSLEDGHSLSGQRGGWALRIDPQGFSVNRRMTHRGHYYGDPNFTHYGSKDCSQLVYGKDYAHKNSIIKVSFDVLRKTCSFEVDNECFGTAWSDIVRGVMYPAVSLGTGPNGRVRIRILDKGTKDDLF